MALPTTSDTREIFEDENIFHDDYQPQSLEERDSEFEQYTGYLQPIINGSQPRNIFLYGKTDVRKTAATKYLLEHLEKDAKQYPDVDITTIYLNYEDLTSSNHVVVSLVNRLRDPSEQISRTGYPLNAVYEMLWEKLDESAR